MKPLGGVVFALIATFAISPLAAEPAPRGSNRAFYSAPPTIPHAVAASAKNESCRVCHLSVMSLGRRVSIPTPHPQYSNCQQCHVAQTTDTAPPTNWIGLAEPTAGTRTQPKAPPTIPHRTFLRDRCGVCHAGNHPRASMRGPHPERSSCRQCHVSDPGREFTTDTSSAAVRK
jgi:nitrate reductase (cytochrome), electron transfer subunit